jgi:dipeptidyl aminopeptidase/acylaminoacyl peptidase
MRCFRPLWCFLSLLVAVQAVAAAPPVEAFTNFPKYETLKISPLGNYLAMTRHLDELENITVVRYPELSISTSSHFGRMLDVSTLYWASNTRMLIEPLRRFSGLTAYKARTGEIIGLDVDGKNSKLLFGFFAGDGRSAIRADSRVSTYAAAEILDVLPDSADEVLIQTYGFDGPSSANVAYRMNVYSGQLSTVAVAPKFGGRRMQFLADSKHQVALSYGTDDQGMFRLFRLDREKSIWTQLDAMDQLQGTMWPLEQGRDPNEYVFMEDVSAPVQGLVAWNLDTGQRRTLFRHSSSDLLPVATDPAGFTWLYGYVDHFTEYWYPDPQHPLAIVHQAMRAKYPDSEIDFTSQSDDMSLAVARVSSPTIAPLFLVVDVRARKAVMHLESRPELKSADLARAEPFELRARDGVAIRGYLTTPRVANAKRLPMVVLVHGGPHGVFDSYGFDWEAQLLASRGYAVLQVNYRGSGGRGKQFEASGYGRWGAEMQDDVTDAVKWVIQDGVADASRICIMGGSFGAYAALTGAFREPDMFRCAVGIAGVYDLELMHKKGDISDLERGRRYLRMAVGTDAADMQRRSPSHNAERIKAAVFLIHGRDDDRAPYEQAARMRTALQKAGNEPEWLVEDKEGHGFFNEKNRAEVYTRILAFLAKHTAPR